MATDKKCENELPLSLDYFEKELTGKILMSDDV
jgi:hypothetical protein